MNRYSCNSSATDTLEFSHLLDNDKLQQLLDGDRVKMPDFITYCGSEKNKHIILLLCFNEKIQNRLLDQSMTFKMLVDAYKNISASELNQLIDVWDLYRSGFGVIFYVNQLMRSR
jgi:hypothetical protein